MSEAEVGAPEKVVPMARPGRKSSPPTTKLAWPDLWLKSEDRNVPIANVANALITLRNHDELGGIVRYDQMARIPMLAKPIPGTKCRRILPSPLTEADVVGVQEVIQHIGLRRIAKGTVLDALVKRADEEQYHPVTEYLDRLQWDGETRIDGWLSRYLGVEGSPYADKIGRLFLIAMVARVYSPGCKSDYMLILEGPQGRLKSTACAVLAGQWFSDKLPNVSHGDAVRLSMHLRGKWLIEIPELAAFASAAGTETLKAFLTQTEERYTPKYSPVEVIEPRQCLFIGNTNEKVYLRDPTGNRRFWPVRVGDIDIPTLKEDRDQLFAEAVHAYKSGAKWWPERDFEHEHIRPEQEARFEEDPWEPVIREWIARENPRHIFSTELMRDVLHIDVSRRSTREIRRLAAILQRMDWHINTRKFGRPYEKGLPET